MSSSMALNTSVPVARSHAAGRHYRRFGPVEIVMHAFMMITFIGLRADRRAAAVRRPRLGRRPREADGRLPGRRADPPHLRGHHDGRLRRPHRPGLRARLPRRGLARVLLGPVLDGAQPEGRAGHRRHVQVVLRQGAASAVRPLHLLGEVRLLGGLLGHVHHRRLGLHAVVPDVLRAVPAGVGVQRRDDRARRGSAARGRASSSRSTSSTATCGRRSSRWTWCSSPALSRSTS